MYRWNGLGNGLIRRERERERVPEIKLRRDELRRLETKPVRTDRHIDRNQAGQRNTGKINWDIIPIILYYF